MLAALAALACSLASAQTFTLDPSTGSLRARFFRDGPLEAFASDHVVDAPSFQGTVRLSSASAALSMTVDMSAVKIDEPAAREAAELRPMAESDRAKFDAKLRGPGCLDVERHPRATLESDSIEPVAQEKDVWHLIGRLSLHGGTQTIEAPVTMSEGPDGGRWFTGYVRLRQSDFGIKPYSVFGGAARLRDDVVVRFALLGRPERR